MKDKGEIENLIHSIDLDAPDKDLLERINHKLELITDAKLHVPKQMETNASVGSHFMGMLIEGLIRDRVKKKEKKALEKSIDQIKQELEKIKTAANNAQSAC